MTDCINNHYPLPDMHPNIVSFEILGTPGSDILLSYIGTGGEGSAASAATDAARSRKSYGRQEGDGAGLACLPLLALS